MVYAEKTIIREGLYMHYIIHDNVCAICAHNRNRYLAYNGQDKNLTGKCNEMDETITECYKFLKYTIE